MSPRSHGGPGAVAVAFAAVIPPVARTITGAFEHLVCRAAGTDCAASATPAPAPAPPRRPPGTTTTTRSCSKNGHTATFQVQTQLKRDPDTGKVFRVITGVSYRLDGKPGTVNLWVFQRAIQTYTDTGKRPGGELPGIGDLNGAEVGIATQEVQRDGRSHRLDIGQWSAKDAPVGTYVLPNTKGILQEHYDYVFVVDPGHDDTGCSFHFDG